MSVQNGVNSACMALRPEPTISLLNFSRGPLKHLSPSRVSSHGRKSRSGLRGRRSCARQRQERIAIYNIDGTFYATEAYCTHAMADLGDGILEGDVIECTLHFGAFHVPTGKVVQPPCCTDLKTFRTEVKDGQVYVDLSAPAATAS